MIYTSIEHSSVAVDPVGYTARLRLREMAVLDALRVLVRGAAGM
jgi:hypothetical protein